MRITIFFITLLLFNLSIVKAQLKGTINYQLTKNDKELGSSKSQTIVYFNSDRSLEVPLKANISSRQIDESNEAVVVSDKKRTFVYKDFSNKRLILSDRLDRNQFLISDSLQNFNWKITKEKRKILNLDCTKAVTKFRGRNYEAWYAENIPVQNGPWKFCGLPGLIVMVYDDKDVFTYELTGINLKASFGAEILSVPKEYAKDDPISHKKFMIMYKKKVADYEKLSRVVQTTKYGGASTITIILPEKMERY